MTSHETRNHTCKPGYWLENTAPLGHTPNWVEVLAPAMSGDPNHTDNELRIFGYTVKDLLAKQY